jgi:hypothetical protein
VEERKQAFSFGGASSTQQTTTSAAASFSSSSGKMYRAPTLPSTPTRVGAASSAASSGQVRAETSEPEENSSDRVTLADRMQNYQRKASSSKLVDSAAAKQVTFAPGTENNLPNLHSATLDVAALAAELQLHPERVDERDNNNRTPLLASCFAKKWGVAKVLVDHGADVTAKDRVSDDFFRECDHR